MIEYLEKLVEDWEFEKALKYAEQLLNDMSANQETMLRVQMALLECRLRLAEYPGAISAGHSAKSLAENVGDWDRYGVSCLNLGVAFFRLGNTGEAIRHWHDFLVNVLAMPKASKYEPTIRFNIGKAYEVDGNLGQAATELERALISCSKTKNKVMANAIRHELIQMALKTEDLNRVPLLLAQSGTFLRNSADTHDTTRSRLFHYKLRAEFAVATKRYNRGRAVAVRGLYTASSQPRHQFDFHLLLANIARISGQFQEALGHAMSAAICAVRSRRPDLEEEANAVVYEITAVAPTAADSLDQFYFSSAGEDAEDNYSPLYT